METSHGLTYSVTRAIGATTCPSVNAICHCFLTLGSCVEVTGPISSADSDGG